MSYVVKRDSGRYQARWIKGDGSRGSKTFARKVDAQNYLKEVDADLLRGTYLDPRAGRTTFAEYAGQWMAARVWRDSTRESAESTMRRLLLPHWGDHPLNSIRPTDVQSWVSHLTTAARTRVVDEVEQAYGYAPRTVARAAHLFGQVLASAVDDRLIPASPARKVSLPRIDGKRVDPLSVAEVNALAAGVPEHLRIAVILGAGVGMRWGEVAGLTIDRVDFLRRRVTIDRQLSLREPGVVRWGPTKTKASNRVVPIPSVVIDELNAHLAIHGAGPRGLFVAHKGKPVRRQSFHYHWERSRDAADLPDVRFHDLRHHCASLLIHAGASVKAVQAQLGHASAAETLDIYAHLWAADDEVVRDAIDAAWRAAI